MNKTTLLAVVSMAATASLHAQSAFDDFEDSAVGDNLSSPLDGGSGWSSPWATADTTTQSAEVQDSPAVGAGKFLAINLSNSAGGSAMGFGRGLAGGAPTGDYSVSFQWRADEVGEFDTSNDRFEFYSSNSEASLNSAGPGGNAATSPYLFGVFGAARGANYTTGGVFGVYNPIATGDGFSGDRYFNLGSTGAGGDGTTISLSAGTTYDISVALSADTQTWDVSVSDGTTTASSNGLNWWGAETQPFIGFGARGNAADEARQFSIDNVQAIPEPGSILLLGLTTIPFYFRRRVG